MSKLVLVSRDKLETLLEYIIDNEGEDFLDYVHAEQLDPEGPEAMEHVYKIAEALQEEIEE